MTEIDQAATFGERLAGVFTEIRSVPEIAGISRIAVALFDAGTGMLHTFAHASQAATNPFEFYARHLREVPSLVHLAESGAPRVTDDLAAEATPHSRRLAECGFRSSYATALHDDRGSLLGFVFIDSDQIGYFSSARLERLGPYVHIVTLLAGLAVERMRVLRAAIHTLREVGSQRDFETGAHLDRMARYARLMARKLAGRLGKDDEWVESLAQFAPLHDIGKIAIPDSILLKPARLSPDEFEQMKRHVAAGSQIVASLLRNFRFQDLPLARVMANVVAFHHEGVDGTGYPAGLLGEAIPIEARIVTVADVFDALTSVRPYKKAWSNDEAFAYLNEQSGRKFDPECVAALVALRPEVETVQRSFREES